MSIVCTSNNQKNILFLGNSFNGINPAIPEANPCLVGQSGGMNAPLLEPQQLLQPHSDSITNNPLQPRPGKPL